MSEQFNPEDYVRQDYEMNPETEDLLPHGARLQHGMVVLVEDPNLRESVRKAETVVAFGMVPSLNNLRKNNRWCEVSDVEFWDNDQTVTFVGTYEDGIKRQRSYPTNVAWLVKKDSIPSESDEIRETERRNAEETLRAHLFREMDRRSLKRIPIQVPEYLMDPEPNPLDELLDLDRGKRTITQSELRSIIHREYPDRERPGAFPLEKGLREDWDNRKKNFEAGLRRTFNVIADEDPTPTSITTPPFAPPQGDVTLQDRE